MIGNIAFLLLTISWIGRLAMIDSDHILKEQFITDHTDRWWSRVMVGVMVALFNPILGLVTGLLFWALFDPVLNNLNGKSIYYIGETAKTDVFFHKHQKAYVISKYSALIVGIFLTFMYGF